MFLAAGNVKFEFEGVTKSGEKAKFKIDKLGLVEFNCKVGEKEVSVVKDGFWNRSSQSLLRILVKMFSEMKLGSIAAKGMKLKLTHMTNVPVILLLRQTISNHLQTKLFKSCALEVHKRKAVLDFRAFGGQSQSPFVARLCFSR